MEEPKEPEGDVLFDLLKLVANEEELAHWSSTYRAGGFGYGDVKKLLADASERYWAPARERRAEWAAKPDEVREILAAGAAKARAQAGETLRRAQQACGLKGW